MTPQANSLGCVLSLPLTMLTSSAACSVLLGYFLTTRAEKLRGRMKRMVVEPTSHRLNHR